MNSLKKLRLSRTVRCLCHSVLMGLLDPKILLNCGENIKGISLTVLRVMNLMLLMSLTRMVWLLDLLKCAMPLRNWQ